MKTITDRACSDLIENIIKEKEKEAQKSGQTFQGIDGEELYRTLSNTLGSQWRVIIPQSVKFTKQDINAVASARYFRKSGATLLMGLIIILLLLSIAAKSLIAMTPLYYNIYYTISGLIGLGFIWIYSRQQAKIRKELWRQLGREEAQEK